MGATSATGTGPGAATNKGPSNERNLISSTFPRIVAAGEVTTDGSGGYTVEFDPHLPNRVYAFLVTAQFNIGGVSEATVGSAWDTDGLANITIIGQANRTYYYAVIACDETASSSVFS